ncbi:MAG: tRNA lysidine(34) synthetase TilS [Gammaproteobacteria bacterium]|nr:tRNA lysidine(34) synthetase TilS [Gammaproteobacteria bacterium]
MKKSPPSFSVPWPHRPFVVACSGGADSVAMLYACASVSPHLVRVLHINHNLQPDAPKFQQWVEEHCRRLSVPCLSLRVQVEHRVGDSLENSARNARYAGFRQGIDQLNQLGITTAPEVWLAHHLHDQVETVLIALGRGAGLGGLSAMPSRLIRGGIEFVRPWLAHSPDLLKEYLNSHHINWIEDTSNQDMRFLRNRYRQWVLPSLVKCHPQYAKGFMRSAQHCAQAQSILEEVAADDLDQVGRPPHIPKLLNLSLHRRANALRFWLQDHHSLPSTVQLTELLKQLEACRTGGKKSLNLKIGSGYVRNVAGYLRWYNSPNPAEL